MIKKKEKNEKLKKRNFKYFEFFQLFFLREKRDKIVCMVKLSMRVKNKSRKQVKQEKKNLIFLESIFQRNKINFQEIIIFFKK